MAITRAMPALYWSRIASQGPDGYDAVMTARGAPFIAVDWGTTHLRAFLADEGGSILERSSGAEGISSLAGSGFAPALRRVSGCWIDRYPHAAIVMAGMIGSRNGWLEAPYLDCPASPRELSGRLVAVTVAGERQAHIVPGMKTRNDGVADVLRGEETLLFGAGVADGIIVLPGTHCKWAVIEAGRVATFRTYMTGEFYGLLRDHSLLRLLATQPEDGGGFARGLAAAERPGGLLHHAFAARTAVLDGAMAGAATLPFLSGLLIGAEIGEAVAGFGAIRALTLIAGGDLADGYAEALARRGIEATVLSPETCFVRGAALILEQGKLR
ncbi:MAG: 2-dehydro-3-deoxygalactonokinase [Pseudomonadota bacterium]|nr:2-dehydro-3-deoxygalactonokinase [Pseudomonadota bacterium]